MIYAILLIIITVIFLLILLLKKILAFLVREKGDHVEIRPQSTLLLIRECTLISVSINPLIIKINLNRNLRQRLIKLETFEFEIQSTPLFESYREPL